VADGFARRVPVGAEVTQAGGVHFRVWAPNRKKVEVAFADRDAIEMSPEPGGYYSVHVPWAAAGTLYKYRLDGEASCPDPASRYQPEGPHHYSQVVDPATYLWRDQNWRGVTIEGQVIYELHIGTFTRAGTWSSALPELPDLAKLGVTVLEVMPVSEFPGNFGWGYDGVHPFAPTRLYGTPDDFRRFVDESHLLGMGVILDVVYNHLGPDGNYLPLLSPHYFTAKHDTDWGDAINFDGDESGPVREFFVANAGYWIDEFHLDGLRLDATQNIYDESECHILAAITREVREKAAPRSTILVGENEPQEAKLIRPADRGGYGMDALWNDDLHHSAMVRLTGHNEAYYSDYLGNPQEFISAAKYGFLFQGQWYKWQHQRRGTPALRDRAAAFVSFIQNHDQVANTSRGLRAHMLAAPGVYRAMTALLLLGPWTPMLFQGQEFASSSPFLFFADFSEELAQAVRAGRRRFLGQFRSLALREMWDVFHNPCSISTFEQCKLDHSERSRNHRVYELHQDLLNLRRTENAFRAQNKKAVDGAVLSPDAFVLRFFGDGEDERDERLLLVNFGLNLHLSPAPEPLLAPPERHEWDVQWSTEDPRYGGDGTPQLDTVENWRIPGQAAVVLKPMPRKRTAYSSIS
jgi:maltooligosyltrehalose trehalohydrolase